MNWALVLRVHVTVMEVGFSFLSLFIDHYPPVLPICFQLENFPV